MSEGTEYLGVTQVANIFGVSATAVYKWEARGILKPQRLPGGRRRYLRTEVERLRDEMVAK